MTENNQNYKKVKVWDIPTRLFHWALVIGIFTSWVTIELDKIELHVISGACILGLLVFRLIWGLIGPATAQFHKFIKSPFAVFAYLKNPTDDRFKSYLGHSPIGALSVVALIGIISIQVGTGLFADDEIYTTGPLAKFVNSDLRSFATKIHSQNFDILVALIVLHLAAVMFYLVIRKNNLITPMITGFKKVVYGDETNMRHPIIWLSIAVVAAGVSYAVFNIV